MFEMNALKTKHTCGDRHPDCETYNVNSECRYCITTILSLDLKLLQLCTGLGDGMCLQSIHVHIQFGAVH